MPDLRNLPDGTPTELIDFAGVASLPRHIEITQRITGGAVTIGRYILKPNPGAFIGTIQYAVMLQEGAPFDMEWMLPGSDTLKRKLMEPGAVHIHPWDTLVYKRWLASSRMLFMAIERNFIGQIVDEVYDQRSIELRPRIGIRDPVIEGIAEAWREELQEHGAGGRIHAEALATALIVHLFRTYGEGGANFRAVTGGMTGTRLRRVVEYIEAHLSEDTSLCTLASLVGFSVHHFNDVFKAETGMAPHHFLIERRVHRAKELLLGSNMPIAEVAVSVGFSGQSHLTLHFRRLTGITPARFRAAGTRG
jgi:AraC family transcriptional regulator